MDMLLSPIRHMAEVDLGHSVALSGRLVRFYSQTLLRKTVAALSAPRSQHV
jgi:hypothetical protein